MSGAAGWYPDPSGQYGSRWWDPVQGWSATAVAGPLDPRPWPAAQPPRSSGLGAGLAAMLGAALLVLGVVLGVAAVSTDWTVLVMGRPLPQAPPLPAGSHVVESFDGSDSDAGWVGLRGSTFTSDLTEAEVARFLRGRFRTTQGWWEVSPAQGIRDTDGVRSRALGQGAQCRGRLGVGSAAVRSDDGEVPGHALRHRSRSRRAAGRRPDDGRVLGPHGLGGLQRPDLGGPVTPAPTPLGSNPPTRRVGFEGVERRL